MNYKSQLSKIKAVLLDVDGVLTQSELILMPDGSLSRVMNTRDGYAIRVALQSGIVVGVITGGRDKMVKERLNGLGVTDIYLGSTIKIEDYIDFREKYGFQDEEILFMGDDVPDIECMQRAGIAACPKDAANEVLEIAEFISSKIGGKGCVREILEQILKLRGDWMQSEQRNTPSA